MAPAPSPPSPLAPVVDEGLNVYVDAVEEGVDIGGIEELLDGGADGFGVVEGGWCWGGGEGHGVVVAGAAAGGVVEDPE